MNPHFTSQLLRLEALRWRRSPQSTHGLTAGDRLTAGFSLLEVLVAMVVASVMIMVITPPMFMVTAARVQQRRAQQALQLAQAEVDRVRATVERGVYTANDLPAPVGSTLTNVAAPTGVATVLKSTNPSCNTYNGTPIASNILLPVDTNGDCRSDFLVQSFRTTGPAGTAVPVTGFQMRVRVYADIPLLRQQLGQLSAVPARLATGSGVGGSARQPLAVLQTTMVRPDTQNSLQNYRTVCTNGGC